MHMYDVESAAPHQPCQSHRPPHAPTTATSADALAVDPHGFEIAHQVALPRHHVGTREIGGDLTAHSRDRSSSLHQ